MLTPPPRSAPLPYTTLFRSADPSLAGLDGGQRALEPPVGIRQRFDDAQIRDRNQQRDDGNADQPSLVRRSVPPSVDRSEEHTSELQSLRHLVCRLLLEKKKD